MNMCTHFAIARKRFWYYNAWYCYGVASPIALWLIAWRFKMACWSLYTLCFWQQIFIIHATVHVPIVMDSFSGKLIWVNMINYSYRSLNNWKENCLQWHKEYKIFVMKSNEVILIVSWFSVCLYLREAWWAPKPLNTKACFPLKELEIGGCVPFPHKVF